MKNEIAQEEKELEKVLLEKKQRVYHPYTEDHPVTLDCNEGKQITGITLRI